jgi:hypothetical protein
LGFATRPNRRGDPSIVFDEVRLYDRFVSTSEIRARYQAELLRALPWAFSSGIDTKESVITTPFVQPEDWVIGTQNQTAAGPESIDWVPGQWTQDQPNFGPIARTCHAVLSIGEGKLLMFGGELRDTDLGNMANGDDTWIYDIAGQRWERVGGGFTNRSGREANLAIEKFESALELERLRNEQDPSWTAPKFSWTEAYALAPAPRCHQGMAYDPITRNAFLLSGWSNQNGGDVSYPDVWTFNVNSRTWTEQKQSQNVPPITDISPVYHEAKKRFLFPTRDAVLSMDSGGGVLEHENNPGFVDELLSAITPRTQVQAMTWYDPDSELVLRFGGFDITPPDGDRKLPLLDRANSMMMYSAKHSAWVLRKTPPLAPSPRVRGAVAYDTKRDRSVLFGGITGGLDSRTSDLWTYETASNTWAEMRTAGAPGPRGGYFGMAYDEGLDVFVVPFGRQDTDTFLDEVWRLALRPEASGTALYTFRRAGYPRRGPMRVGEELPEVWPVGLRLDWSWTGEQEPTFAVRVGEDGLDYGDWKEVAEEASNGGGEVPPGLYIQVRVTLPPGTSVTRLGFDS